MDTHHRLRLSDARSMEGLSSESVELVVTSPPYPMIELWDALFADLDPSVKTDLEAGDGRAAFDRMHAILDTCWSEVQRVLVPGGIACINIGDATRRLDGKFRRYPNHARITRAFDQRGFDPLPSIHWHKPTNAATKFMGSGMIPPNAYATQEHEHVLLFRKGSDLRSFEPRAERRYEAAYFWEERNRWFADRWTDVAGRRQALSAKDTRERAAAFPLAIPYRLIAMFSVYGDTVLDPFMGTGTTLRAAMASGRHSIGVELDEGMIGRFDEGLAELPERATSLARTRLERHAAFVTDSDIDHPYEAVHYELPVKTQQERQIRLYGIERIESQGTTYQVSHQPIA